MTNFLLACILFVLLLVFFPPVAITILILYIAHKWVTRPSVLKRGARRVYGFD